MSAAETHTDDRPRLVVALTDGGKPGVAFQIGCILAMRALGVLARVKVFSAVGSGVHIVRMLNYARLGAEEQASDEKERFYYHPWETVCARPGDPSSEEEDPLFDAMLCLLAEMQLNLNAEILKRRFWSPSRWLEPWEDEIPDILCEGGNHTYLDDTTIVFDSRNYLHRGPNPHMENPIFLVGGLAQDRGLVCFTNDPDCPSSGDMGVVLASPDSSVSLEEIAAHVGFRMDGADRRLQPCTTTDALGTAQSQVYFTKERLGQVFGSSGSKKTRAGMSKQLVLLDAYSWSGMYSSDGHHVQQDMATTLQDLLGPEDIRNEGIRLYNDSAVQMFDRAYLAHQHGDASLDDDAVLWYEAMKAAERGMQPLHAEMAESIVNWGFLCAYKVISGSRHGLPVAEDAPFPEDSRFDILRSLL